MGTPESAVPSLRRCLDDGHEIVAVWTQPDRPSGRGNKLHASPVKEFAARQGLTTHQPAKIRTDETKSLFTSHQADVAVVVAFGRILPAEFLGAPRHGCVNVHFSLLPKYRGAAPVNWAIVNGETETGVTTMQIVQELDAGPILLQQTAQVGEHDSAPALMARLAETGAELLSETLRRLDTIPPQPQRHEEATFAPILKRQDGLIDWTTDAFAIERRVRGFQPWPNAYTNLNSRRLIIWQAIPENGHEGMLRPGQIVQAHGDELVIGCESGTLLRVIELQLEGKRRLSTRDFINGMHVQAGEILGSTSR